MTNINELLERGVDEVIDRKDLETKLKGKKKLRVKLGIDPTSPNIHIGRAVALWKLRQFQELGHKVVFIVGDFTGLIGDTSDKDSERPMLATAEIKKNLKTYFEQAFKILDRKKTETHFNSKWLKKLGFLEIAELAELFSLHEFESRENIAKRLKAGKRVSLREVLYPLMQGYDSVSVKADVELGGTDQRFNLLAGRTIQPHYKQLPQNILMTTLLEGTDGRKMSSSWGNVINITDKPNDMFGKTMAIEDKLIIKYLTMATRMPMDKIRTLEAKLNSGENPRNIKLILAHELTALYHGEPAADKAILEWEKVFSQKEKPTDIASVKVKAKNLIEMLVEAKLAQSKSEARRLVAQNAVKINDSPASESSAFNSGDTIQVGKRKFIKIK